MQNENVVLTDIQVHILEQEYERDETSGTIQRPIALWSIELTKTAFDQLLNIHFKP